MNFLFLFSFFLPPLTISLQLPCLSNRLLLIFTSAPKSRLLQVAASFRRQKKCPFLSVLQFSSLSDHLRRCPPPPREHQRVRRSVHGATCFHSWVFQRAAERVRPSCRRSFGTCASCSPGRSLLVSPRGK